MAQDRHGKEVTIGHSAVSSRRSRVFVTSPGMDGEDVVYHVPCVRHERDERPTDELVANRDRLGAQLHIAEPRVVKLGGAHQAHGLVEVVRLQVRPRRGEGECAQLVDGGDELVAGAALDDGDDTALDRDQNDEQ